MKRRDVLVGAGALALAAVARAAPAKTTEVHHRESASPLTEAAAECVRVGEACEQHCLVMLGNGDTSMAACGMAVRDMLASVRALLTLAAAGSKHVRTLAPACATVCKDCEAECRKHADKHPPCKDCAEACARMQAEIARLG